MTSSDISEYLCGLLVHAAQYLQFLSGSNDDITSRHQSVLVSAQRLSICFASAAAAAAAAAMLHLAAELRGHQGDVRSRSRAGVLFANLTC
jgi:hypothetical protein